MSSCPQTMPFFAVSMFFFFFTHPKGCWSSSCCSQSLQATGSVVKSYWSLMAPWLRGISSCFRKPRNQLTGKGRSGLRFEKQREGRRSGEPTVSTRRILGTAKHWPEGGRQRLICRVVQDLSLLYPSEALKATEKGRADRPPHFFSSLDSTSEDVQLRRDQSVPIEVTEQRSMLQARKQHWSATT